MKTVIECEKRAGLSTCPVCGHMAPDWCGEKQAEIIEEIEDEPVVPKARKKKVEA